jgi:hypothetical protein
MRTALARRNMPRRQRAFVDVRLSALTTIPAITIGSFLGMGASVMSARQFGVPSTEVLRGAFRTQATIILAVGMLILVTLTLLLGRRTSTTSPARRWWGVSDFVGVGSLAVLVALSVQRTSSGGESGSRMEPLFILGPWCIAGIAFAVTMRLMPLVLRVLRRGTSRPLDRFALRPPARNQIDLATVVALLVAVSSAIGVFGVSVRTSVEREAQDVSAALVPLDATLAIGSDLRRPRETEPSGGWPSIIPAGAVATDVLRRSIDLTEGTTTRPIEILGLSPSVIPALRFPRMELSASSNRVSQRLSTPPPSPIGTELPSWATSIELQITGGQEGVDSVRAWVILMRPDGTWFEQLAPWTADEQATAPIDASNRGSRLVGLRFALPDTTAQKIEHNIGAAAVDLGIGEVVAVGANEQASILLPDGLNSSVATVSNEADRLLVSAELQGTSITLLPTSGSPPLRALVDKQTAKQANDGILDLSLGGEPFAVEVVATSERFPTLGPRFVVVDAASLERRLHLLEPGTGTPNELWIGAEPAQQAALESALNQGRYAGLDIRMRADEVNLRRQSATTRIALALLFAVGVGAIVIALLGLVLALSAGDEREAGFHRWLLISGTTRRGVSQFVRRRVIGSMLCGLLLGAFFGVVAAQLAAAGLAASRLEASSINTVLPPLRIVLPWSGALIVLVIAALLSWLTMSRLIAAVVPSGDLLRGPRGRA